MRLSPRLGFRIVLVVIAVAIICLRLIPRGHVHSGPGAPATDLSASSLLNQPGGGPAPAAAYDIYSALYQTPSDEPLAFANDSQTDVPQVGASCLKPSTAAEHAMADAFVAANQQSHAWEQKFTIPQGYTVLSADDTAEAQACLQTHGQDRARCAAYKQVRHLRFLGVPGFDASHTHALVSVIKSCGGFCGNGGIFEVEKAGGTWKRAETTDFTSDCSWTY